MNSTAELRMLDSFMAIVGVRSQLAWSLAIVAAIGTLLSMVAHGVTFLGIDPQAHFPHIWIMHVGMFAVFVPAVLLNLTPARQKYKSFAQMFPHAPPWMGWATQVFFVYALANFAIFIYLSNEGQPREQTPGQYVLKQKSVVVRPLSASEFHRLRAYEVRGVSGHWMLFFSASTMAFVSAARRPVPTQVPE